MNTEPLRPEIRDWLMQERAANLPAVREQQATALPSRVFPELNQPQPVVVHQPGPDPWVWRPLAFGAASTMTGLGIWFSGLGIHAIGSVSLWAIAAMCISLSAARVFAPRREAGARSTTIVVGSHNRISR